MKKTFLFFATLLFINMATGQKGWTIKSGNRTVNIITPGEQEVTIDASQSLWIEYDPATVNNEMNRSIILYDDKDAELYRFTFNNDKGTISIGSSNIAGYFKDREKVFLYTIALPKDPKMAAAVRVMRQKVCTLVKSKTPFAVKKVVKKKKTPVKKKGK